MQAMSETPHNEESIPEFHDRESLENTLIAFDVSEDAAARIAALGRYTLHLVPSKKPAGSRSVFSKIGGAPDLPAGTAWPIRPGIPPPAKDAPLAPGARRSKHDLYKLYSDGQRRYRETPQPYNFIAQISFAEMAGFSGQDLGLPDGGAFYLFYDVLLHGWGYVPEDAVGFKVLYLPDIANVAEAPRPEFHEHVDAYKEVCVEPVLRFESVPSYGGTELDRLSLSEDDDSAYFGFEEWAWDKSTMGRPGSRAHKLRGWANNIQNAMEEECALVTSGLHLGGSGASESPEAKKIRARPNDWVLLLQIDSDEAADMLWGDLGMMYLWIRKSDLEARNFEKTWLILQCD